MKHSFQTLLVSINFQFIRKYKLGKVLQRVGRSGYCAYRLVQFDLKKLAEYDPEGMEKFLAEHEKKGGQA